MNLPFDTGTSGSLRTLGWVLIVIGVLLVLFDGSWGTSAPPSS